MPKWLFLFLSLSIPMGPTLLQAQPAQEADFDGSGTVDFSDFLEFAQAYGSAKDRCDLDGNGTVDFPDFLLFVRAFQAPEKEITDTLPGNTALELVWIDPGTFLMGSPDAEPGRDGDEGPQHEVSLTKGFYLGKYEVTQAQWQAIMETAPWSGEDRVQDHPDHPAVYISWHDAQEFIHRLNEAANDSLYRLPTEAEWEYACRAGTTTLWSFGDNADQLEEYTWFFNNTFGTGVPYAHPVGTKRPNPWGLYDMHGNVWEWVQDWFLGIYPNGPRIDPAGPEMGLRRVVRGGGLFNSPSNLRSAIRSASSPSIGYYDAGFRLLRRVR